MWDVWVRAVGDGPQEGRPFWTGQVIPSKRAWERGVLASCPGGEALGISLWSRGEGWQRTGAQERAEETPWAMGPGLKQGHEPRRGLGKSSGLRVLGSRALASNSPSSH